MDYSIFTGLVFNRTFINSNNEGVVIASLFEQRMNEPHEFDKQRQAKNNIKSVIEHVPEATSKFASSTKRKMKNELAAHEQGLQLNAKAKRTKAFISSRAP